MKSNDEYLQFPEVPNVFSRTKHRKSFKSFFSYEKWQRKQQIRKNVNENLPVALLKIFML